MPQALVPTQGCIHPGVSKQGAAEGGADEQQPGEESLEAEES